FARPDRHLPDWRPPPDPEAAAAHVIPAYLGTYGPAPLDSFEQWLYRGALRKSLLRSRVTALGDRLVEADSEGERAYARAEDVAEIEATEPAAGPVRLLPAFDQFVLGPGTKDTRIIPAARRAEISKTAGWISPVVVAAGRVAGTWES